MSGEIVSEDRLVGRQLKKFRKGKCPNCGQDGLRGGPCGGLSQNIICTSCGARYNNTPFGVDVLNEPAITVQQASALLSRAYRKKEWIDYVPAVMLGASLIAAVAFFIVAVWSHW